MKTLIFGTSYCEGQQSRYLFTQWLNLVSSLNPEADILVVDSASPDLPDAGRAAVLQLGDNIGHLSKTGRDGWGRAFCNGLQVAIEGGYDYVAHIETDLLFARPVASVFEKMHRKAVTAACPMAFPYQFIETALMFFHVGSIKADELVFDYDWENVTTAEFPEIRLGKILDPHLFTLPLWGLRNDTGLVTPRSIRQSFPNGCDWITHADPATCREFLRMNGHA